MTDTEKGAFQNRLDKLSDLLRARSEEFRQTGEFSDIRQALLTEIQQRRDELRKKVTEAETQGSAWELVKREFDRDLSSLYDDLLQLNDRLDSEVMKNNKGT